MSIDELLRSGTALIAGLAALIGSLVALLKALAEYRKAKRHSRTAPVFPGPIVTMLKKTSFALSWLLVW